LYADGDRLAHVIIVQLLGVWDWVCRSRSRRDFCSRTPCSVT